MSTMVGNWKMAITDGCRAGDRLGLFNLGSGTAHVELTFCAEGSQPLGPFRLTIPPQRTQSPALEDLAGSDLRSPSLPYSVVVVSDTPVLVQPHPADQDASKWRRSAA
ncbi:sensory rhodopsin transducer [Nonomuraea zeae]|uniref:Uncharacterized protein n=1 Tax=Nonomuraea zeae TaxID=1642303 RepID=A0A5S4HGE0_9ACTN|nr:sensory rhodopsin transducer [Nonomuraea zeae]TMR38040.1 hypothetical protein ETD85_06255 [Nonomuraea zeae]